MGIPLPEKVSTRQERIAELAKTMPGTALHSLSRNMDLEWMREAHRRTRKDGATGVDDQTAADFGEHLEENLQALLELAKSGLYRAPPVRRKHLPKGDGKTRPIGIPTFSDKVLQRAIAMLLEPIYEQDFMPLSYGFRPGRSAHDALTALRTAIWDMGGGWALDVDVSKFFDTLDHERLREILRQRVTDGVVVRLIGKWLNSGVLEGGVLAHPTAGTPQGGVISPLLANIYLHEVLDAWWVRDVLPRLSGKATLIRYADDFVIVFTDLRDAERVQAVLPQRFARFGLQLHPEKTRRVDFRRPSRNGKAIAEPGTFDFLGFTHYWALSRAGRWVTKQKTARGRFSRALVRINEWCRDNRHKRVVDQAKTLGHKLRGHFQYYGITGNSRAIGRFRYEVVQTWKRWLGRRSQRAQLTWEAMNRLLARYPLPAAIAVHSAYRLSAKP
jgi:group II intron reverse transcriptase/maturase